MLVIYYIKYPYLSSEQSSKNRKSLIFRCKYYITRFLELTTLGVGNLPILPMVPLGNSNNSLNSNLNFKNKSTIEIVLDENGQSVYQLRIDLESDIPLKTSPTIDFLKNYSVTHNINEIRCGEILENDIENDPKLEQSVKDKSPEINIDYVPNEGLSQSRGAQSFNKIVTKTIKEIAHFMLDNATVFVKIAHRGTTPDQKIETKIGEVDSPNNFITAKPSFIPVESSNLSVKQRVLTERAAELKNVIENSKDPLERHTAVNGYEQTLEELSDSSLEDKKSPTVNPRRFSTGQEEAFISSSKLNYLHQRIQNEQEKKFQMVKKDKIPTFAPTNLRNFNFEKEDHTLKNDLIDWSIYESQVIDKNTGFLKNNIDTSNLTLEERISLRNRAQRFRGNLYEFKNGKTWRLENNFRPIFVCSEARLDKILKKHLDDLAKFYQIDLSIIQKLSTDGQKIVALEMIDGLFPTKGRNTGLIIKPDRFMGKDPATVGHDEKTRMSFMFDSDIKLDFQPLISVYEASAQAAERYKDKDNFGLSRTEHLDEKKERLFRKQSKAHKAYRKKQFYDKYEIPPHARADSKTRRHAKKIIKLVNLEGYEMTPKDKKIVDRVTAHYEERQKYYGLPENSFEKFIKNPTLSPDDIRKNSPKPSTLKNNDNDEL